MTDTLPTATLGRTGLEVTRLGFGAMEIRGGPRGRDVTPAQADRILNAVLDSGINYIDTSIDYGQSEEFIGQFISQRRDEYYLASKCGCHVGAPVSPPGQRSPHIFTKENIVAGVEQSLRRMRTDYLDAVQFHSSPSRSVLEDHQAIDTLHELRDAGKIRFVGMSGTLPELPGQIEMGVFDLMQIPYSALQREHETWITTAAEAGIGTVIRGGVAKGEPGASGVDRAGGWGLFEKAGLGELREEGESSTGFMLRFTLSHPGVDTIIVGTLNADHLADNVSAAARGPLAPDVYEAAKERLVKAGEASA